MLRSSTRTPSRPPSAGKRTTSTTASSPLTVSALRPSYATSKARATVPTFLSSPAAKSPSSGTPGQLAMLAQFKNISRPAMATAALSAPQASSGQRSNPAPGSQEATPAPGLLMISLKTTFPGILLFPTLRLVTTLFATRSSRCTLLVKPMAPSLTLSASTVSVPVWTACET